jgi:hypothetical protein
MLLHTTPKTAPRTLSALHACSVCALSTLYPHMPCVCALSTVTIISIIVAICCVLRCHLICLICKTCFSPGGLRETSGRPPTGVPGRFISALSHCANGFRHAVTHAASLWVCHLHAGVCCVDMSAENLGENSRLAARNPSLGATSRSCSRSRSEKPGEPGESCSCAGYARMCELSRACENSRPQKCSDRSAQWLVGCALLSAV